MHFQKRTRFAGELRLADVGTTVTLNGWIHRIRDLGSLFFADIRDRTGLCQLFFDVEKLEGLKDLRSEVVVAATGKIANRSADAVNPKIPTGEIELVVESDGLMIRSHPVRQGWDEQFRLMAENGDDKLLDAPFAATSSWDETEWQW